MVDTGLIVKGIGGFYYVETANGLYECKARGVFRKKKITPLVGDKVSISINDNAENTIDEIFERKNSMGDGTICSSYATGKIFAGGYRRISSVFMEMR